MHDKEIRAAKEHFGNIVRQQLERVDRMREDEGWVDYGRLKPIVIGVVGGDGIGPIITKTAQDVLESMLKDEIRAGKVRIDVIGGLTIENRVKANKAIPDDVLARLKRCHVILKGPTTTPKEGDPWPNIESANVAMRRELDLYANIRPVKVPKEGIDWVFFRENTEGAYILGSSGIMVTEDLAFDFTVATDQGCERIIRMAFDYAAKNGIDRVSVVTKSNVIKTTDGLFLSVAARVARDYPNVKWDDWFIDIMTAKLVDPKRRADFKVLVLPNLYGDILTDEAAEFQGGVGTAGSANIGRRYAMFEAIHGSAPRMVAEGRAQYADPSSMLRATVMLLGHIGYGGEARRLEMALDLCVIYERKIVMTGRQTGATNDQMRDYVMETLSDPKLKERWMSHQKT